MSEYTKIGRIRPVFKGAWNNTTNYTVLDIVRSPDGAAAYAALKDVPAGTELSNAGYWQAVVDVSLSLQEKDPTVPAWLKDVGTLEEMRALIGANAGTETTSTLDYTKFSTPVLYLTGSTDGISKDDKVNLEYTYQGRAGACTLKWQGSSAIAFDKKNFTIEFDTAFEAKSGWGSQKKYCLKANWVDASNMRNLFGASLWSSMLKCRANPDARLAALPNGGAVDGFPIWLVINGDPQGLYTFNIPKEAWMFGMTGSNAGEGFVCAEAFDFTAQAQFDGYDMKVEYSAAADASALKASFNNLVSACNQFSGEGSKAAFEALVDVESVIDYCIFVVATSHFDGINRNYLMGTFDGTKWFISAYDMDQIAGLKDLGTGFGWTNDWPSFSDFKGPNRLFEIIMTYYADQVKTRYKNLRYWQLAYVDWGHTLSNMASKFPAALVNEDFRLWPARPCTLSNDIHQIESYLQGRMTTMDWNVDLI